MNYTGKVVKVIDGDTVDILIEQEFFDINLSTVIKVRLNEIDAPETRGKERNLGGIAKEWLKKRVENKTVEIELFEKDVYKRWLGVLYHDGENINERMLKEKLVERYSPDKHDDGVLETE